VPLRLGRPSLGLRFGVVGCLVAVLAACSATTPTPTAPATPASSTTTPGATPGAVIGGPSTPAGTIGPNPSAAVSLPATSAQPSVGSSPDASTPPSPAASPPPNVSPSGHFPGGLLIADRGNGRIIAVNDAGAILWKFPNGPTGLPRGQLFSADDAFISPDGKSIVANEEDHQVIVRIDIATDRVVWEYGVFDQPGPQPGHLWNPDDAYPLANGDITVADIKNCRILEIAPDKQIVRQWGQTSVCANHEPRTFYQPNGDTPLPDGGMLVTEIVGSCVIRLDKQGNVVWNLHVPISYPSDAQLNAAGNVVVVSYTNPGSLIVINPTTHKVLYRYAPRHGNGKLDHPSLGIPLPDGTFVLNDDYRARVIVIDPRTNAIIWQYGKTGSPGPGAGRLNIPDGVDPVPVGIFVKP